MTTTPTTEAERIKKVIDNNVDWLVRALAVTEMRLDHAADAGAALAAAVRLFMGSFPADRSAETPEQKALYDAYDTFMGKASGNFAT